MPVAVPDPFAWLKLLEGQWQGACRTWLQPAEPPIEESIQGNFRMLLDGKAVRHTYTSQTGEQSRTGEETIIWNAVAERFETTWFDSFHMNYAIMFSRGARTESGFEVTGQYDVAAGQPAWGWKTQFELCDTQQLIITSLNVSPDGEETPAMETRYTRLAG